MKKLVMSTALCCALFSCDTKENKTTNDDFQWQIDQFDDVNILRFQVPGFEELTLLQKKLIYFLSESAQCGRDILFDQNYKYNLAIRRVLEHIYLNFKGDKNTDEYKKFVEYLKKVWFANGIHHHYSTDKFPVKFTEEYFKYLVENTDFSNSKINIEEEVNFTAPGVSPHKAKIVDIVRESIFNPSVAAKRVNQANNSDLVTGSACNFYENISQDEVEDYYASISNKNDTTPISYGLNSKIIKNSENEIEEITWSAQGMYKPAIEKVVYWLEKAATVCENKKQEEIINKLIEYYKTGDLNLFDEYNIAWVNDTESTVDFVNGFIENYGDPMGLKATWESVVNFKNFEATKRTQTISDNAQWFEDHSPVAPEFRKEKVKGVSAKVITVAMLGGDCYPSTPIGINLPNADWIRKDHGSKSVTIENITYAYSQASLGKGGSLEEFAYTQKEVDLAKKYGTLAGNLNTDLHECLGHGSGQLAPGVKGDELKNYGSPLEEARASLFALYYIADPKMVELGLIPSLEVAHTEYDNTIRNGIMTQLTRIELGKTVEQAHMRCRKLMAEWAYELGKKDNIIEKKTKDGKTFFVVNDYEQLRTIFGEMLAEVQRIKSEGDYEAGKNLIETYAVNIDQELHKEVLERYAALNLAPYNGFVNPVLKPILENGDIVDIIPTYEEGYVEQMLRYSNNYSYLPTMN